MDWLTVWDVALFRWINRDLGQPWLDPVMRFLSGNELFVPALVVTAVVLLWRGGRRGLVFVVLLGLGAALANEFLPQPLKDWFGRPRPYTALDDVVLRVGRGNPMGSLPSAHAMNVALIATFITWYYRPAAWVAIPVALVVGVSRIYNGVHYPTDVLAGFAVGAGFGAGFLWVVERLWRRLAPPWCPRCARWLPSLLQPPPGWGRLRSEEIARG